MTRKIIHVDMDAFYASVEQRDDPVLRGRPVIVGAAPDKRGVVAAASYEARVYGVHSAMPSARAVRLCPDAVFIAPRFEVYRAVSRQIRAIFHSYTWRVEPLALDEAYLDVTGVRQQQGSATRIARAIKRRIHAQTGLTASAGVSYNKLLAKLASDMDKPDGLVVITPERARQVLQSMAAARLPGIGRVTAERLRVLGIYSCADLAAYPEDELIRVFGRAGRRFAAMARGQDERVVEPAREPKSIGAETTFAADLSAPQALRGRLAPLVERVAARLQRKRLAACTVTLKIKYADFEQITRRRTLAAPLNRAGELQTVLDELLQRTVSGERAVRLIGVSASGLTGAGPQPGQGLLFSD